MGGDGKKCGQDSTNLSTHEEEWHAVFVLCVVDEPFARVVAIFRTGWEGMFWSEAVADRYNCHVCAVGDCLEERILPERV